MALTGKTIGQLPTLTSPLDSNALFVTEYGGTTYSLPYWQNYGVVTGFSFNINNYDLTLNGDKGLNLTQSLAILSSDMNIVSGSYNPTTGVATFVNNSGGTFNVTGFLTGYTDFYITGGSYSNGTLTLNQTNGIISISGFLTGTTSISGSSLPVVRNVYLVQDNSDAIRMGGNPSNVYTTFQSAYDAANTLQTTNGGRVVITVGNVSATTVGDCYVTSWNNSVSLAGINRNVSSVGSIVVTGTTVPTIFIQNLTVGRGNLNIYNNSNSGIISLAGLNLTLENSFINREITTKKIDNIGNSGNVTVSNSFNSTISTIIQGSTLGGVVMTSSSGNSGNFSMTNCSNLIIGAFSQAATGNCGTFTMSNCPNIYFGGILDRRTTPLTNVVSMGNFSMTNCNNVRFASTTNIFNTKNILGQNLTGGSINFNIDRTNKFILFSGSLSLGGSINTNRANVSLWVRLYNSEFLGGLAINGGFLEQYGGFLKNLDMESCTFTDFYLWNFPISSQVGTTPSPNRVFIQNCKQNLYGNDYVFRIVNYDVSYNNFMIKNYLSDEAFATSIGSSDDTYGSLLININETNGDYNLYSASTVPFMITNQPIILDNINIKGYLGIAGLDPVTSPNSGLTVNCYVYNSTTNAAEFYSGYGDFNYRIENCNIKNNSAGLTSSFMYGTNFINGGLDPSLNTIDGKLSKPIYIYNSNIPFEYQSLNPFISGYGIIGRVPFIIENSYVELGSLYDVTYNPYGGDIILNKVYNSHIVGVGGVSSINSISGTVYTTTITRPSTTLTTGVTFYNSYDDIY